MRFVLLTLIFMSPSVAVAEGGSDKWQFQVTPYLWLPTIGADLNYDIPRGGGGSPSVEAGPTDWWELLNGAALVNGSARKGRFSISTDLVYLSMSSKNNSDI